MIYLNYFLLLSLIPLSLQENHCLNTFEICRGGKGTDDTPPTPKIANCLSEPTEGVCYLCKEGYALSSDQKSCISFQNCNKLQSGNDKCETCLKYYHLDSKGQCQRTLCEDYDENDKDKCLNCYDGYYLKDNTCKKITIPHCLEWDETNCKECDYYAVLKDGKCEVRSSLIKGCHEYDDNGKCTYCISGYTLSNGSCNLNKCSDGQTKTEYCGVCQTGYFTDSTDGKCVGYDGTKDTEDSVQGIKIEYFLLIFLLALLI